MITKTRVATREPDLKKKKRKKNTLLEKVNKTKWKVSLMTNTKEQLVSAQDLKYNQNS